MEGGPGYPSIGSASYYRFMLGPLLERHNLILMDQRGTGLSGPIYCRRLQNYFALARPEGYPQAAAACARQLGAAANAYGSTAVGDDLAAILHALGIHRVDVYGDSYGSYAAQVFTLHHPALVRALVLDGTYNQSFNPFEPEAMGALRNAWTTLCERSPSCGTAPATDASPAAAGGGPGSTAGERSGASAGERSGSGILALLGSFARALERHPLTGVGVSSTGARSHVVLTAPFFAQIVFDATYYYTVFRDLPAAIHAADRGDTRPLLRLAADDAAADAGGGSAAGYSVGDLQAVSCHDYPTIWKAAASPAERREQLAAAIARLSPGVFSPFSKPVWLASLDENELVAGCLDWPKPAIPDPPFPKDLPYPRLPVLILDGEFDQATPVADALKVARSWPDSTFVEVANSGHVTGLSDFLHCTSALVRLFMSQLRAGDTSCADRVPPVYVVPEFPPRLAAAPADLAWAAKAGGESTAADRRAAWVTGATVGDALSRWFNLGITRGPGLYGGTYRVSGPFFALSPLRLVFSNCRFTSDLAVSGRALWDRQTSIVTATLQLRRSSASGAAGRQLGSIELRWSVKLPHARALVTGSLGGRTISLEMAAPWSASP